VKHLRVADGTRLAYRLEGPEDAPAAVLCDGISCDGFVWRYLRPWLRERFRILHVHYRGHGRSGFPRDLDHLTIPHLANDVAEVMDRTAHGPAVLLGHSMGVQVVLETAFRHPERVRAGVLLCGSAGRVLDTFQSTDLGMRLLPAIRSLMKARPNEVGRFLRAVLPTELSFQVAIRTEINADLVRREDFMPYLDHCGTMPPDVFVTLLEDAAERTADPFLGRLDLPMLVVAGDRDGFTPAWVTRTMARALPRAELRLLRGGTHTAPIELAEDVERAVGDFVQREGLDRPAPAGASTSRPRSLSARFLATTGTPPVRSPDRRRRRTASPAAG
jgi:pimeloyl-ACP methyl ester carboxylesterase